MKKVIKFTAAVMAIAFTVSRLFQGDYAAACMSTGLLMALGWQARSDIQKT